MPPTNPTRRRELTRRLRPCAIDCAPYLDIEVKSLSDYFGVIAVALGDHRSFWFRGHPLVTYSLTPSALRYSQRKQRERALASVVEMRRFLEFKLPRPPGRDEHLAWLQVAQHYGLPTRLLDWTQNAAAALFFACNKEPNSDGLVVIVNPIELNQIVDPRSPRIFNPQRDQAIIDPYLKLDGLERVRGKHTIAINPTWNNERIALQQGAFTLHGSRKFELDRRQAASLRYIPILYEYKASLLNELHRVGIGEMFLFPEPEHVCSYLKQLAEL